MARSENTLDIWEEYGFTDINESAWSRFKRLLITLERAGYL